MYIYTFGYFCIKSQGTTLESTNILTNIGTKQISIKERSLPLKYFAPEYHSSRVVKYLHNYTLFFMNF